MILMGLHGFGLGDYTDSTPCAAIPVGDPYRVPGNFCSACGTLFQFNSNGAIVNNDGYAVLSDCSNASSGSGASGSGASASTGGTPTSDPWWSTALTSLVKGTTQAIIGPGGTTVKPPVAATPWYSTPLGMLGIALGVIGGGYLLLKK